MTDPSTGSGQDRRFIEESFPVKEVGVAAAKEKNIRHGHISTLHIWWARRPLAASRATAYAALTPSPQPPSPLPTLGEGRGVGGRGEGFDSLEWQKRRDFIVELCQWENSLNPRLLEKARRDILEAHAARLTHELGRPVTVEDIEAGRAPRPRVLDPFAGGGSYPLEALRLGCEAYASDYNPVAVLILKATLEYPQRFGHTAGRQGDKETRGQGDAQPGTTTPQPALFDLSAVRTPQSEIRNPLLDAVKRWGDWVLEEARKELAKFYPPDPPLPSPAGGRGAGGEGAIPVGYIWARTIPCQNPACGAEIPLMRQFWLAKKDKKRVALWIDRTRINTDATDTHGLDDKGKIRENPSDPCSSVSYSFRIVGDGYEPWPEGFDPGVGTVARAVATCPCCGAVVDDDTTRRMFQEGKAGQRMVAVVLAPPSPRGRGAGGEGKSGKTYRVATPTDEAAYRRAEAALQAKREQLMPEWGMDPVPDEPLPPVGTLGFRIQRYGMIAWGDLFNARQQLALITFAEKVRQAHAQMLAKGMEPESAKAVATYLALAVDKLATFQNVLTRWNVGSTSFAGKPDQEPTLAMKWDYAESNPFSGVTGSFSNQTDSVLEVLNRPPLAVWNSHVSQISANNLNYEDGLFDAALTDPPYYDNFPYAYLADFFYVWLKRMIGHLHLDLFSTPLTPKAQEIVAYSHNEGSFEGGRRFFEENLKRAFQEIHRVLKPDGTAVIVYAHKSTAGWETIVNALLDSGLVVTGAWPLSTEREARQRAQESAALASSIYIVARKMARQPTGFYNDVRAELRAHLEAKLHRLWEEGIGGADFFIAAIGSAIEVFGKYERVMDYEGNAVRADRLLDEVRTIATDYAVRQILRDGFAGEVSDLTRFYVLWRWNYGEALVPFDEARKLAQSCGVDLAREWGRGGFVRKEKEFVRVLGPQQRKWDESASRRISEGRSQSKSLTRSIADSHEMIDVLHYVLLLWEKSRRDELVQVLAETGLGRSEAFYRVAQAISETLPNESKEKKLLDGFLAGRERVREEVGKVGRQGRLWE
jgi:adenine-specific DNA methylase